jgi:hypothetical protein
MAHPPLAPRRSSEPAFALGALGMILVASVLEEDAEIVSDSQLQAVLAEEPPAVQEEILAINDQARSLPRQIAMLISVLACLAGLVNGSNGQAPHIEPLAPHEGLDIG